MFLNPKAKPKTKASNEHCWETSSHNKGPEQQLEEGWGDVRPSSGSHGPAGHRGCQQELKWASIHSSPNRAGKGWMERKAVPPTQLEQLAHGPNRGQAWLNRIPLPHHLLWELSSHNLMRIRNG